MGQQRRRAEQAVRRHQRPQGRLHPHRGEEPLGADEGRHELGQQVPKLPKFLKIYPNNLNITYRYYLNQFRDAYRQAAIDVMTGQALSESLLAAAHSAGEEEEDDEEVAAQQVGSIII